MSTACSPLDGSVLVLNRMFMAVHVISVRRAFTLLTKEVAEVVNQEEEDGQFISYDFRSWRELSEYKARHFRREQDDWIRTVSSEIQVPRVIRLLHYERPIWRTVKGGSARYVDKLTAAFKDNLRLGATVTSIERTPKGVVVRDSLGGLGVYDHVVIGAHSDQALSMLADPSDDEREILGSIGYAPNLVYLLETDLVYCWSSFRKRIIFSHAAERRGRLFLFRN